MSSILTTIDRWRNNGTIRLWSQVEPTSWKNRPILDLFNESETWWKIGKVISLFPYYTKRLILAQHIRPTKSPERLYWPITNNREYNSKSGYIWLMSQNKTPDYKREVTMWNFLWALRIPSCWEVLLWKVYHSTLPIGWNRCRSKIGQKFDCPYVKTLKNRCNISFETAIFLNYFSGSRH